MDERHAIEMSWQHVFSVCWVVVWRWALITAVLAYLIGFFGAATLSPSGLWYDTMQIVLGGLGGFVSLIVLLFVVRAALGKRYRDFHLELVPNE